jgi:hypothetical protein
VLLKGIASRKPNRTFWLLDFNRAGGQCIGRNSRKLAKRKPLSGVQHLFATFDPRKCALIQAQVGRYRSLIQAQVLPAGMKEVSDPHDHEAIGLGL